MQSFNQKQNGMHVGTYTPLLQLLIQNVLTYFSLVHLSIQETVRYHGGVGHNGAVVKLLASIPPCGHQVLAPLQLPAAVVRAHWWIGASVHTHMDCLDS
jgi:hypothetical protein